MVKVKNRLSIEEREERGEKKRKIEKKRIKYIIILK